MVVKVAEGVWPRTWWDYRDDKDYGVLPVSRAVLMAPMGAIQGHLQSS